MAKLGISGTIENKSQKRKGVHAKSKTSKVKTSKIYKKINRGQGR